VRARTQLWMHLTAGSPLVSHALSSSTASKPLSSRALISPRMLAPQRLGANPLSLLSHSPFLCLTGTTDADGALAIRSPFDPIYEPRGS
jgi:hypothetical protein